METLPLPMRFRQNHYKDRTRTNLSLDKKLKNDAAKAFEHRYGFSLSEGVNQLLRKEVNGPGLLRQALNRR